MIMVELLSAAGPRVALQHMLAGYSVAGST
jgi:hypothetical protein